MQRKFIHVSCGLKDLKIVIVTTYPTSLALNDDLLNEITVSDPHQRSRDSMQNVNMSCSTIHKHFKANWEHMQSGISGLHMSLHLGTVNISLFVAVFSNQELQPDISAMHCYRW